MPSTSRIPAFVDALKALLDARPAIIGPPAVTVATGDLGVETPREAIVLGSARAPRENRGLRGPAGISQDENARVLGVIWIVKAGQGEEMIKASRDRAYGLLGELEQTLKANPTVSGTCHFASVAEAGHEAGANDQGRWTQVNFEVRFRARLT